MNKIQELIIKTISFIPKPLRIHPVFSPLIFVFCISTFMIALKYNGFYFNLFIGIFLIFLTYSFILEYIPILFKEK